MRYFYTIKTEKHTVTEAEIVTHQGDLIGGVVVRASDL